MLSKLKYPFMLLVPLLSKSGAIAKSALALLGRHKKVAAVTGVAAGGALGVTVFKTLADASSEINESIFTERVKNEDVELFFRENAAYLNQVFGTKTLIALDIYFINKIFGDNGLNSKVGHGTNPKETVFLKQMAFESWIGKCGVDADYNFFNYIKDLHSVSTSGKPVTPGGSTSPKKPKPGDKKGPWYVPGDTASYEEDSEEFEDEDSESSVETEFPEFEPWRQEMTSLIDEAAKERPPLQELAKTYDGAKATAGEYQVDEDSVTVQKMLNVGWPTALVDKSVNLIDRLPLKKEKTDADPAIADADVQPSSDMKYVRWDIGSVSGFKIWPYAMVDCGYPSIGVANDGIVNKKVLEGMLAFYNDNKLWQKGVSLSGFSGYEITGAAFPKGVIMRGDFSYDYNRHKQRNKFYSANKFWKQIHVEWKQFVDGDGRYDVAVESGNTGNLAHLLETVGLMKDSKTVKDM